MSSIQPFEKRGLASWLGAAGKTLDDNGGAEAAGLFLNCASVTGSGGALPASGVGRSEYVTLPGLTSLLVSMKYATGLIVLTRDCAASALFGPGAPSLSMMPSDSRLAAC